MSQMFVPIICTLSETANATSLGIFGEWNDALNRIIEFLVQENYIRHSKAEFLKTIIDSDIPLNTQEDFITYLQEEAGGNWCNLCMICRHFNDNFDYTWSIQIDQHEVF